MENLILLKAVRFSSTNNVVIDSINYLHIAHWLIQITVLILKYERMLHRKERIGPYRNKTLRNCTVSWGFSIFSIIMLNFIHNSRSVFRTRFISPSHSAVSKPFYESKSMLVREERVSHKNNCDPTILIRKNQIK